MIQLHLPFAPAAQAFPAQWELDREHVEDLRADLETATGEERADLEREIARAQVTLYRQWRREHPGQDVPADVLPPKTRVRGERAVLKCTGCQEVISVPVDGIPTGCACGGSYRGGQIRAQLTDTSCDARCTEATSNYCQCKCVGANHGSAYLADNMARVA